MLSDRNEVKDKCLQNFVTLYDPLMENSGRSYAVFKSIMEQCLADEQSILHLLWTTLGSLSNLKNGVLHWFSMAVFQGIQEWVF